MRQVLLVKVGEPSPAIREAHGPYEAWFSRVLEPLGGRTSTWDAPAGEPPPEDR